MTDDISSQYVEQIQQISLDKARRTVTCAICSAVYMPSQAYGYLALTSSIALESALMGMSHFCFRCRRPACPQCWDEIHGVCGACAQDAHLPFRMASTPLKGVLFVAAPQTQGQSEYKRFPLACIQHGRFQRPTTLSKKSAVAPVRMQRSATLSEPQSVHKAPGTATGRPTRELSPLSQDDITELDTQPAYREDIIELDTRPTFRRSIWGRVEHTATICISLLLLLLLVTVLLALVFPSVNMSIVSALHIDIRAEIAYLLQLITHLH